MADMLVDEISIKAKRLTDESANSCRRMVQMTQETINVGGKTTAMLDEQGEKLRNVKHEVGQIEQEMKRARKNVNELSKCCGLWPRNRVKSIKSDRRYEQGKELKKSKRNVVTSQQTAIRSGQAVSARSAASSGLYNSRITNDEQDEMEENLEIVDTNIGILKIMAVEMGKKISDQNQTIEDITNEVTDISHDVFAADKQLSHNSCDLL
ncbi:synaptosomal-associated protein 23-like [Pseudorasbora parva]|uniref:synaptosomal-associated protein 23-like n=1 Tax=Pseudorasbora parva TaxID=51549 RepID=UPI00351E63A4